MSKTERKLRAVSLILIAVLVFTVIFNVAYVGNTAFAGGGYVAPSSVVNSNNGFVKSDMNFDSVREQYLNHELVQKNTASYDGDRWVIVKLAGATLYDRFKSSTRYNDFASYAASVEGKQAEKSMKIAHTEFLKKLERHGIDYQLNYTYTSVTNAVAIKVNAAALNSIKTMSGVEGVFFSEYYDVPKVIATNDTNVYTTGIYDSHDLEYQGDGMVVAILDTGLDHTHEAFATMPENGKFDINYIENKVSSGELKAQGVADDFYYNEKVPFAYDYADNDPNVYPSYSSHGTHVAGIVAGSSEYVVAPGETFVGVAPDAQLVICKVFTDNLDSETLGGASTMGILAALEDCVTLGVDVINMSLGSSAGFSVERGADDLAVLTKEVYGKIEDAGISLVVAASNDYSSGFGGGNGTNLASNPDSGTVGSPSTYAGALSVASINGQKSAYIQANSNNPNADNPVAFITNASDEFSREIDFIGELYKLAAKRRGVESIPKGTDLKFKYVVISGVGQDSSYTNAILRELDSTNLAAGVEGTIAFVKRGDNTFEEKVLAAMGAKADAIIIYNNVAGTIRMSIGDIDNPIPACSISMDAGKAFVELAGRLGVGYLTVNTDFEAGPFMSEFSSWGPTPSLELKPEITAHGGEITSAVAGGYDKLSGTSMASPNMAGAVALLRQYLQGEYHLSGKALNARINQVLMSTATIANNEENNPYSPRKQGAGLARIKEAIETEAYITVKKNGEISDKTKIELGDDASKNGVYKLEFIINNISDEVQSYKPITHVMTETMSSDNKTVAEKAYMLTAMSNIKYETGAGDNFDNMTVNNGTIQVQAGETVSVRVTITLSAAAKQYLDSHFENGMYVEGFVSLENTVKERVTIGLPYLAFYGDWTDAPMFDYDEYEIAADEMDTNIPDEEKIKASAAATMPVGMYYEDKYILPLGSYIYAQDEDEVQVYPERDKIAVSMFDDSRGHSIYELYMLYAGMLRGAAEMDLTITDDATGNVIFSDMLYNVRKSYAGGGANRGAPVMIEIKPNEWGLQNNSTYSVHVEGRLDYEMPDGKKVERDSFDFPFTVDYEAPEMLSYRIRYMSYTENRVVKYRIFMDVDVRDNQYVQTILPCYITTRPTGLGGTENVLTLLTEYPIPVMGQKGETTTVSFEITDIYEEYVKTGKLYLQVEDYALNANNYQITPGMLEGENAMNDPVSIEFVEDEYLVKSSSPSTDATGNKYYRYTLTLPSNTLYTFNTVTNPANATLQSLTWSNSDGNVTAKAQGNQLYAGNGGITELRLRSTTSDTANRRTYAVVRVVIDGKGGNPPVLESININAALNGDGVAVPFTGPNAAAEIELNPNQVVNLTWNWSPWYAEKPAVEWTSSNTRILEVNQNGQMKAIQRGTAYVTVTAVDRPSVSTMIKVVIGREYDVRNYTLYNYYGTGDITIRDDLNIMYLDEDCFKGNTSITSVKLPDTLTEIPENAFMGCTALKEVIIPGQCITIKENAFAGCTALEKITLGKFVDSEHNAVLDPSGNNYPGTIAIGRRAFSNCTSLTTIENQERLTTLYSYAFENCTSLEEIDLSELRVVANGVFKGCTNLKTVHTDVNGNTVLGRGMFEGCTSLVSFDFYGNTVPRSLFLNCSSLTTVNFMGSITSIGSSAFEGTGIANMTLPNVPNGEISLSADAFKNSALATLTLSAETKLSFESSTPFSGCGQFTAYALAGNNSNYYSVDNGLLYNKNKTMLVAVPFGKTSITLPTTVTSIANGALSGVNITTIDVSAVENLGSYAFAGNTAITTVVLPSGLTAIPNGLFEGCSALTSVTAADNFAQVATIGANAFRGCTALETFGAANIVTVGARAFENSGLKSISGAHIKNIGESAFENSKLESISMLSLEKVGTRAFALMSELISAELGAIVSMGDGLFVGCDALTTVSFAEGTTAIEYGAFASLDHAVNTALTVSLPSSVTRIEQFAFYNRRGLTSIDLSNVRFINAMAFTYTGLSGIVDLGKVEQIGSGAFAFTGLTTVNLPMAWFVASEAFYDVSTLTSVTFGALKRLGEDVFSGTSITTVTLPDTFNERTYKEDATTFDKETQLPDHKREREALNYAAGAFNGARLLTEIKASNDVFFDIDGVLYSRVENGLVLEQYPTAKVTAENSYKVADNTVIIANNAFMGVSKLEKIELPYTVKTIGSSAFFNSSVKDYTFNSVDAPTLLTGAASEYAISFEPLKDAFDREGLAETNFYSNFYGYAILADEDFWKLYYINEGLAQTYDAAKRLAKSFVDDYGKFELTMTIPRNARGYNETWQLFFETINYTEDIMPDDTTHRAMEAIGNLPTVEEIKNNNNISELIVTGRIGALAQNARKAYNAIVIADQRALVADQFETLIAVEKALRDKKEALGQKVNISSLVMSQRPNKIIYEIGEEFDPTGMILTAIYEDGSEVPLEGGRYDISPSTMAAGVSTVTITYQGISTEIRVQVNGSNEPTPVEPVEPENGLSQGAKIGIGVGVACGVIVIAGVAVLVIMIIKKKKAGNVENGDGSDDNNASDEKDEDATAEAENQALNAAEQETPANLAEEVAEQSAPDGEPTGEIAEEKDAETAENTVEKSAEEITADESLSEEKNND